MRIDLREIKTYVITTNPVRRAFVSAQLAKVGITPEFVEGVRCSPKIVGCGLSHLKVLRNRASTDVPYLILEDDVAVTEDFRPVIETPRDAAAVYLGVSTWGITDANAKHGTPNAAKATRYHDGWLHIQNMLSSHAILYTRWEFAWKIAEAASYALTEGIPFDVEFAKFQAFCMVFTPERPFFYQSAEVGGAEDATRFPLIPKETNHEIQVR